MKMYTDVAALYIKLSSVVLAVTGSLHEKILGGERPAVDLFAILIWIDFLLAIEAGTIYHYLDG